jgi:assimilatory nitrate reductase catalytic subunit
MALLAGRPLAARPDVGAIVCACLKVGKKTIDAAITAGCRSAEAVGAATGAGTNCGSCRPQIAPMIAATPKELSHAA